MLLLLALLILVFWLLGGFIIPVGSALVHVLIVVALVLVCIHFLPQIRGPRE